MNILKQFLIIICVSIICFGCAKEDDKDMTSPECTVLPLSGSIITYATMPIVFSFSESMDISSLELSGTMVHENMTTWWVPNNQGYDSLILYPEYGWDIGTQTLIMNASDLAGNPMPNLYLTYEVLIDGITAVELTVLRNQCIENNSKICVRYNDTCDIECAGELADHIRKTLGVPVLFTPSFGPINFDTPGCIGCRSDIGGTPEIAQALASFLGGNFFVGDCHVDGFIYNLRANKR